METVKESSREDTSNVSSSLPNADDTKTSKGNGATTTVSATAEDTKLPSSSTSKNEGPRRQSTRSIKAPKPFSPPMGGIKGVSATAKKALAGINKKGISSSNASLNNTDHTRRFIPILYDLIEETHNENQNIISWSRDGKSFMINPEHDELEETIEGFFSHGKLRSLQRQLHAYAFKMDGHTYRHPQFHRGMDEEEMIAIPRKSRIEIDVDVAKCGKKRKGSLRDDSSRAEKVARRSSSGSSKANDVGDGDDISSESLTNFAQTIHNMLEENKNPAIMKWTAEGKAFNVDPDHPDLGDVLEKYFQHRNFLSLKRQLNQYGWTKPQAGDYRGMLFNPAFYRNMPNECFDLIRRKDARNYIPLKEQLKLAAKLKKEKESQKKQPKKKKAKKGDPNLRVPPVPAAAFAVAQAAASSSAAALSTAASAQPKTKSKKIEKTTTNGTLPPTKKKPEKKRKNPPLSSQDNAESRKKVKKLSPEVQRAKDRLEQYKQLHGLYNAWTLFNMPASLKSHIKKCAKKSWNVAPATSGMEGLGAIKPDAKYLICEEVMPEWLVQDEKEILGDLEEMIIRDRKQRQARHDAWSRKYSIAKGKTLPPSKFNRPNNKWQKLSPGDRIDVYWHDDKQYYTANVVKHQESTSYFHLFYEEDGAMEWLDLSREDFKLLENRCQTAATFSGGPSTNSSVTVENTSREDKYNLRPESVSLPENHAHLAPFLRYSWDSLGLGKDLGTPAYNQFIRKGDAAATEVTPLQILQDIRALRTRGFSAQPDIDLRVDNDPNIVNNKLTTMMRDLQDDIAHDFDHEESYKHFETTLSTIRKVTDHWGIPQLIGNMQRLETRVATLEEREARVLERLRCKHLL